MLPIRVRKVRRICGVRGCRNLDSYAIARSGEPGFSVIMCPDCVKETFGLLFPETEQAEEKAVEQTEEKAVEQAEEKAEEQAEPEKPAKTRRKKKSEGE